MKSEPSFVALDGRLIGGTSTGDSTYWTCLAQALRHHPDAPPLRVYSDRPKPNLPFLSNADWVVIPSRSSRWWSLVSFPLHARNGLIHTQYTLSPLARRAVTTIHDVSFLIGPQWFKPRDRMLLQSTVPASARRARRVITVSETSRREIERRIPSAAGKIDVTPLACPPWIQPTPPADDLGGPYVLTVSTRWPRKNMQLVVEAMARVGERFPHRLVLTGKAGWAEGGLGARGITTGYVDEARLCALYSGAALYLAPSHHEGFGIPVLEAMRCGCPVLASAGGALPETVGDGGVIEPSSDPDVWARRIESLLDDPQELAAMRNRGHQRERRFSWDETATRTIASYRAAGVT